MEHNLNDLRSHVFVIGEKKLTMSVPSIKQSRDYARKVGSLDEKDEAESLDMIEEYFEILGVTKDDFNELTIPQIRVMLETINDVPK